MKVEVTYPTDEQMDVLHSFVQAEQAGVEVWSSHVDPDLAAFIDAASLRLPCVLSNACKNALGYLAGNDQHRVLLLLAVLKVIEYWNELRLISCRVLFTVYQGNIPSARELDALLTEQNKALLKDPASWSV